MADRNHPAAHRPDAEESVQRIGALVGVPQLLALLDAEPHAVLAAAGLDLEAFTDREARVPYAKLAHLLDRCVEATRHPQFGLLAGRLWHVDDLGLVGELMRHSATVGEALEVFTVYQHLNSGGGLVFLLKRPPIVDFGYAIYQPGLAAVDQIQDCVLAAAFNFVRELAGAAWLPSQVFLSHRKLGEVLPYRALFKVAPRFDSELCALRFPSYWLERRIEDADPARRRAALMRAHALGQGDLPSQVRRALRLLLVHGRTTGDDLAEVLSIHRRTLNRRLQDHGTTFQQVLDEVRFEVARQLLTYSDIALDDIAAALGYAGVSPFMRTFRRWTGMTPGQWRRESTRDRVALQQPSHDPFTSVPRVPVPLATPQGPWRAQRDHEVEHPAGDADVGPLPRAARNPSPDPPQPRGHCGCDTECCG